MHSFPMAFLFLHLEFWCLSECTVLSDFSMFLTFAIFLFESRPLNPRVTTVLPPPPAFFLYVDDYRAR
jgi:hypothetical protein